MTNYIIVYKDGEKADWCTTLTLKNTQPSLILFICRKETVHPYSYGEHANYAFCNRDGNDAPLKVGDVTIYSFKTHGTKRNFILSWELEHSGIKEEYALCRDNIWYYTPSVDYEWSDPIKDTIRLIRDILRFGLDSRRKMDALKREIYSFDYEIELRMNRYFHLRDIDFEKSGLNLSTYAVELPRLEKQYKEIADIKSKIDIQDALNFLRDEADKRERTINLLEEGNEVIGKYASSLATVYIKEGVTTIEDGHFDDCKCASIVVLPSSVTSIVQTAFNFTHVKTVYITSPTLVLLTASHPAPGIMLTNTKFYVPQDMVKSYRTNMFWKPHADRILAIKDDELRQAKQCKPSNS